MCRTYRNEKNLHGNTRNGIMLIFYKKKHPTWLNNLFDVKNTF